MAATCLLLLVHVQLLTKLVEAIYFQDLLNLSIDEKVAGLFALFSPLLLAKSARVPRVVGLVPVVVAGVCRALLTSFGPVETLGLAAAGVAATTLSLACRFSGSRSGVGAPPEDVAVEWGLAAGLAAAISWVLRAAGSTLDVSLISGDPAGVAWGSLLGGALALLTLLSGPAETDDATAKTNSTATTAAPPRASLLGLGLGGVLAAFHVLLFAPAVLSRWTGVPSLPLEAAFATSGGVFAACCTLRPDWVRRATGRGVLLAWNGAFAVALVSSVAAGWFPFPASPTSGPVLEPPAGAAQVALSLAAAAASPVVFLDLGVLATSATAGASRSASGSIAYGWGGKQAAAAWTVASVVVVLVTFALIFTNAWGYVEPVSGYFRNAFWLPVTVVGACLVVGPATCALGGGGGGGDLAGAPEPATRPAPDPAGGRRDERAVPTDSRDGVAGRRRGAAAALLVVLLFGSAPVVAGVRAPRPSVPGVTPATLRVMTFNLQQGANASGAEDFPGQLGVVLRLKPDLLALQECDTARISSGNVDAVRYFAESLGYYSYAGPRTTTGTFGVAMVSRYPIVNASTFFTHSDVDEVATAEVWVRVGDRLLVVFVNHPDGSPEVKQAHVDALLSRVAAVEPHCDGVLALGDFNFRPDSTYYEQVTTSLADAWAAANPSGDDGSGVQPERRIDHVFASAGLAPLAAAHLASSHSDHPALWADLSLA
ncbi:MAG: hypothetical protein Kow0069_17350 [Promethearchaeota archaeon]